MTEHLIRIDVLEYDDDTLWLLSAARMHGLLVGKPILDSLADGGAQNILSWGREFTESMNPAGVIFQLSKPEFQQLQAILKTPELARLAEQDKAKQQISA